MELGALDGESLETKKTWQGLAWGGLLAAWRIQAQGSIGLESWEGTAGGDTGGILGRPYCCSSHVLSWPPCSPTTPSSQVQALPPTPMAKAAGAGPPGPQGLVVMGGEGTDLCQKTWVLPPSWVTLGQSLPFSEPHRLPHL